MLRKDSFGSPSELGFYDLFKEPRSKRKRGWDRFWSITCPMRMNLGGCPGLKVSLSPVLSWIFTAGIPWAGVPYDQLVSASL